MKNALLYPLQDKIITLHLRKTAKRNIILRPHSISSLQLSIPPWLTQKQLLNWLDNNQSLLQKFLSQAPIATTIHEKLPESLWYRGKRCTINISTSTSSTYLSNNIIYLPNIPFPKQKHLLHTLLIQHANNFLLPRLHSHSKQLEIFPTAIKLSNAKGYWGVCRKSTGIRLNWRLIGAPNFVVDYVCIHELCHLIHANHSPQFWALTAQYAPYWQDAKNWLKQYGSELFVLG